MKRGTAPRNSRVRVYKIESASTPSRVGNLYNSKPYDPKKHRDISKVEHPRFTLAGRSGEYRDLSYEPYSGAEFGDDRIQVRYK